MVFQRQRKCEAMPRLRPLCALLLSVLSSYHVGAKATSSDAAAPDVNRVQFEEAFLVQGSGRNVDLSRFEEGNVAMPGMYHVDIYVNQSRVTRVDVPFKASDERENAQPCFDAKLLERVGVNLKKLTPAVLEKLAVEGACLRIEEVVDDASATFDVGDQRLDLGIPQISLARNARGYVGPDDWDLGVPAAVLGYNFNLYNYNASGNGGAQTQGYLGLNAGFNLGNWHFRHNGSFTFASNGQRQYQANETYAQRDLPSLSSQLTIGEAFTTGDLFNSTAFRGVRVATDDRMLPDSMRGYAPTVYGVASSNAKVTIRQNNVIVYETTVAPGAFEIDDLYATGYGGDLEVSVREADGSVHSFSVPYAAVPLSLRPGGNRYSFVAGTVRDSLLSTNPLFMQATWQRGFTNLFTGYGGVTAATGYAAALVGGAFNTSPFKVFARQTW
jgi:outer membrane usher protein